MISETFLPFIYIFGFFAFIIMFDIAFNYFMQNSFIAPWYRIFIAPGVIIHELSHALAVKLTLNKIKKINFFTPEGGYVAHTQPRNPLNQIIISFAPIIGISLSFLLITRLLTPNIFQPLIDQKIPDLSLLNFSSWTTWLYIYLSTSLASSIAPSKQDFKVALPGIILSLIVLSLISISSLGHHLTLFLSNLGKPLFFLLYFMFFALLLSILIYFITILIDHFTQTRNYET